jgi:ketosteroid isomerase-like protein
MYAALPVLLAAACRAKEDPAANLTPDSPTAISPQPAANNSDPAAVRHIIDSLQARFVAAADRGDMETILADYVQDPIVIRPNQPLARGRDAVRKAYGDVPTKGNKVNTQDVLVSGDLAVETGTYEVTLLPKGGSERKETGKYVFVWQRQPDGTWKGVRDAVIPDSPTGE